MKHYDQCTFCINHFWWDMQVYNFPSRLSCIQGRYDIHIQMLSSFIINIKHVLYFKTFLNKPFDCITYHSFLHLGHYILLQEKFKREFKSVFVLCACCCKKSRDYNTNKCQNNSNRMTSPKCSVRSSPLGGCHYKTKMDNRHSYEIANVQL